MSPTSFQHNNDVLGTAEYGDQSSDIKPQSVTGSDSLNTEQEQEQHQQQQQLQLQQQDQIPPKKTLLTGHRSTAAPLFRWAPTNYLTPAFGSFGNTTPVMNLYRCTNLVPAYGGCHCCCNNGTTAAKAATSDSLPTQSDDGLPQAGVDIQTEDFKKETWSIGFYEVGDVIGQGNYARVRKGHHRITKIPVTVSCYF
ncbi:unnamed protein product [Enterobius vermicularis]|uniref:Protein kinase domain-containing protein n=1 Tax=Enterobius vermicularis TaxID=51028 RepID=A0A0N4VNI3_ENTVE|nr:unnamed protein product [Enterobius vermicularis]